MIDQTLSRNSPLFSRPFSLHAHTYSQFLSPLLFFALAASSLSYFTSITLASNTLLHIAVAMSPTSRVLTADLRILHFLIPVPSTASLLDGNNSDNTTAAASMSVAAVVNEDNLAVAKLGTHDWRCQLTILEDRNTLRATIVPIPSTDANLSALGDCCTLQVLGSNLDSSEGVVSLNKPVLLIKKIRSEEIFTRGIECEYLPLSFSLP